MEADERPKRDDRKQNGSERVNLDILVSTVADFVDLVKGLEGSKTIICIVLNELGVTGKCTHQKREFLKSFLSLTFSSRYQMSIAGENHFREEFEGERIKRIKRIKFDHHGYIILSHSFTYHLLHIEQVCSMDQETQATDWSHRQATWTSKHSICTCS